MVVPRLNAGKVRPGDVFALNAPCNGGAHLPDITVVSPVFDDAGGEMLFWVDSRGHHADVGGCYPPGPFWTDVAKVPSGGAAQPILKAVSRLLCCDFQSILCDLSDRRNSNNPDRYEDND